MQVYSFPLSIQVCGEAIDASNHTSVLLATLTPLPSGLSHESHEDPREKRGGQHDDDAVQPRSSSYRFRVWGLVVSERALQKE